jgi:hypothetical protein
MLDEIISTRREMADLMGYHSYSDYKAADASLAHVRLMSWNPASSCIQSNLFGRNLIYFFLSLPCWNPVR